MKQEHKVSKKLVDKMIEIHFPFSGNPYDVTVMEMLDVVLREYTFELYSTYWNEYDYGTPDNPYDGESNPIYQIKIYDEDEFEIKSSRTMHYRNNIPDAIACKILWLHENNYISFTK